MLYERGEARKINFCLFFSTKGLHQVQGYDSNKSVESGSGLSWEEHLSMDNLGVQWVRTFGKDGFQCLFLINHNYILARNKKPHQVLRNLFMWKKIHILSSYLSASHTPSPTSSLKDDELRILHHLFPPWFNTQLSSLAAALLLWVSNFLEWPICIFPHGMNPKDTEFISINPNQICSGMAAVGSKSVIARNHQTCVSYLSSLEYT